MLTKENIGPIITVASILALIIVLILMMFVSIPAANKDLFNVGLMGIIAAVSTAFGFWLGGSNKALDEKKPGPGAPDIAAS